MTDNTLFNCPECNLRDRHEIAQDYYVQFMNRLDSMFKWSGLPDTIPEYILERYLKINGWCGIGKATVKSTGKSGLYCFFGGLGSAPDEYYRPTEIILANPVLGSKSYKIGVDCVWAKNDQFSRGLSQLVARYAHLLAANDISINVAQVTSRIPFVLTAETQAEVESAKEFLKQAEEGKIGIVKTNSFNNGVSPQTIGADQFGNKLKALIELQQFLKGQFNNDVGIGSNFNMKRERITEAEKELDSPYLLPLVDEMLKFRQIICDEVNAMFGQNWSVELASVWELENLRQDLAIEQLKNPNSTQPENGEEAQDGENVS